MQLWTTSFTIVWVLLVLCVSPGRVQCRGAAVKDGCWRGEVRDQNGYPVGGASVSLYYDSLCIGGTASSCEGGFEICHSSKQPIENVTLRVQSIAHNPVSMELCPIDRDNSVAVILKSRTYSVNEVTVKPRLHGASGRVQVSREEIGRRSSHSPVLSDPVNAVRQPQVIRAGSNASSKIRVAGTNPVYYLNGLEIGQDPHHYGVFTMVPASMVERLDMYLQGAPAGYGSPSVIDIQTPWPDKRHTGMDFDFSIMDVSATATASDNDYFVLGTVRKSILDLLVNQIDEDFQRTTIPPTSYRDIFAGGGLAVSDNVRIALDQFLSQDYLSYSLPPSGLNPQGINTYQSARRECFGGRVEINRGRLMVHFRAGYRSQFEQYYAKSGGDEASSGLYVDLKARRQTGSAKIDMKVISGRTEIRWGQELVISDREQVSLRQKNWNFLSPDATSDNPFIYQEELNRAFARHSYHRQTCEGAGFLSLKRDFGPWALETGLRAEYFDGLSEGWTVGYRTELSGTIGAGLRYRIGHGSYYENPVSRVLEAYQIVVRAAASELTPVKTSLVHIGCSYGPITIGGYRKDISRAPIVRPDFSMIDEVEQDDGSFLKAVSDGRVEFVGGDIAFDLDYTESHGLSLFGYYAFARAEKTTAGIRVPYELNARHAFYIQGRVNLSGSFSLRPSFMVRSGYAYTPLYEGDAVLGADPDSPQYYENYLRGENSRQFPASLQINVQAEYAIGRARLFFGVNNLTNHANAIINTHSGYVYDVGIMPVLGLNYSL